jgi:hypothetical protein
MACIEYSFLFVICFFSLRAFKHAFLLLICQYYGIREFISTCIRQLRLDPLLKRLIRFIPDNSINPLKTELLLNCI